MIVPSPRLLAVVACVIVPAVSLAFALPRFAPLALAVVAGTILWIAFDAISVRRRTSTITVKAPSAVRWTKDLPGKLALTLTSEGKEHIRTVPLLPAGLGCELPVKSVDHPGGTATLEWDCVPTRRGSFPLPKIEWEQTSAGKLWHARSTASPPCEVRVYPNLRHPHTRTLLLRRDMENVQLQRQFGKGREFDRLREYSQGDAFDDISWKATARRLRPIVKVTRVERMQQVYIAIDTSRLAAREGALDAYIDLSLHLSLACQKQRDQFGLITFNDRMRRFLRAGSGAKHFGVLREALYGLEAARVAPDFRDVFSFIQRTIRKRSLIVFLTFLEDAALAEEFIRDCSLITRRHVVVVHAAASSEIRPAFAGAPPQTDAELYERLAGQIVHSRLQETAKSLRRVGARFQLLDRDLMRQQVVGSYLDLKRRQAL